MNGKNVVRNMSVAVAALAVSAVFADPFSGIFVEGGLGVSQLKSEGQNLRISSGPLGANPNRPIFGDIALKAQTESGFAGRLGIGYAYTFPAFGYSNIAPDLGFNLAGLLTYNFGSQKLKDGDAQFSGQAFDNLANESSGWTAKLKDAMELRVQPGFYFVRLHTLFYGTVGYARAKFDSSGQDIRLQNSTLGSGDGVVNVGNGSQNLNGLVLGFGAKFSPIANFYVGFDYSHVSYKSKKFGGQTTGQSQISGRPQGPFPVSWESDTGKIKTDTYLLTAGYYFF